MKSSQIKSGKLLKINFFLVVAISFVCFFSCSKNVSSKSFFSSLDDVDRFISLSQPEPALKILSKIDNAKLPIDYRIGIYKRYLVLGETKKAQKLLKSAYNKNPNDLKIVALYTKSLLKNSSTLDEKKQKKVLTNALEISKKLKGSKYSSIYAESFFAATEFFQLNQSNQSNQSNQTSQSQEFFSKDFIDVYYNAYLGTKNNDWLRNCASIKMFEGQNVQAFEYLPRHFINVDDAYFWALICYDNKKFIEASNCLIFIKENLFENESGLKNFSIQKNDSFELIVRALLADCYVNMGEERLAEKERSALLGFISSFGESEIFQAFTEEQDKILSAVYLNSALYALSTANYEVPYRLLTFVVNKWQDFVPGLIAYGNFAFDSNLRKLDDSLTQELRRLKISSMKMKTFDEFPAIPVEDALYRMNQSYSRNPDVKLFVARLELEDKYKKYSEKEQLARIYQTLERNSIGTNLYPREIVHYAICAFLKLERVEEAKILFKKFILQKYKFDENENFYDEFFKNIHKIENWEIEYEAFFAATEKKSMLATRLYEFSVLNQNFQEQKSGEEKSSSNLIISPFASNSAVMNLAMIYSSTNNRKLAFELYGQAANRSKNILLKSECFYRIGVLYQQIGDAENAIKSLKYSIYLNPNHSKARLLLSKL